MSPGGGILALVAAALLGVAVPYVGMRMLLPGVAEQATVRNYRGRPVTRGLGIVWLLWSGSAMLAGALGTLPLGAASGASALLGIAGILALIAFSLGLVDDVFGSVERRGFSGHVSALGHGRLTTGMLKLLGISLASLVAAGVVSFVAPWGDSGSEQGGWWLRGALVVVAGATVALTANFVNLTDLRPGRALKVYVVLGVAGAVVAARVLSRADASAAVPPSSWVAASVLLLFVLGPAFAVWGDDLGERGMLGDAGANPAGAVAGLLLIVGMTTPALVVLGGVMLALNLVAERVSYSAVIERTAVLGWLDGLGRRDTRTTPGDMKSADPDDAGETDGSSAQSGGG